MLEYQIKITCLKSFSWMESQSGEENCSLCPSYTMQFSIKCPKLADWLRFSSTNTNLSRQQTGAKSVQKVVYSSLKIQSGTSQDIILFERWNNGRKERGERCEIIGRDQHVIPFLFFPASVVTIIKTTSTTMMVENRPRILKNTR